MSVHGPGINTNSSGGVTNGKLDDSSDFKGNLNGKSVGIPPHEANVPSVRNHKKKSNRSVQKILAQRKVKNVGVSKNNLVWNKAKTNSEKGLASKKQRVGKTALAAIAGLVIAGPLGAGLLGLLGYRLSGDKKINNKKPLPDDVFSKIQPGRIPHKEDRMIELLGGN